MAETVLVIERLRYAIAVISTAVYTMSRNCVGMKSTEYGSRLPSERATFAEAYLVAKG